MIQYILTNELKSGSSRYLVADYSARVRNVVFATNARGFAECTAFIPMGLAEAFSLYDLVGLIRLQLCDTSSGAIYDGRVEDIAITGDGVTITALGFSRALSDAPYTALWSDTSVAEWRPLTTADNVDTVSERYQFDTNNRLFIAPQKGAVYANTGLLGAQGYAIPDQSSRQITGISFDFELLMPANWEAALQRRDSSWGFLSNAWTLAASGVLQTGSVNITLTACDRLSFRVFYNAAAAAYAGETGAAYFKVTRLRVVTTTANRIDTTFTANRAAGASVTATVGSTARMYAGQRLNVSNALGTTAESVTVSSVTNSTQFVATFSNSYVIGDIVRAHVVYGDEIADDLITTISTLNPGQLSSSLALTDSPALDLQNETYLDKSPADILDYLAGIGDASGNQWEWGIRAEQRLYFRQQNNIKTQRTWYVDVSAINVTRLLDQLTNSVYAVYADANNRTLRTSPTSDTGSIARYGVTRRVALSVSTTSATQAAVQQATALTDGATPQPQSSITVDRIFDANGARWPLWYVQAGDTVVIRNLAPTLSTSIDRIRIFRLARAEYAFDTDTLSLEPETPLPRLDALLAKIAAGVA